MGERSLDLDASIYFLSISSALILLSLGGLFRAHRFTYYVALVSGYFHLVTYVKFIFYNKNSISSIADFAIIALILLIVGVVYTLDKHYRNEILKEKFSNNTLDRFSKILFKRNDINRNE
ncbi:hypothetical protein VUJ46_16390 [Chryseobacterium sp. MYb264]|uniref:hypothetical protein n=1 Tax=Chryseobacterium sp. MYb264 TaxID=2745153 RepID=UPI002E117BE1|nr:hypothetical protein VUJ46_16390 [Chryseobacterium sp. MYb264]